MSKIRISAVSYLNTKPFIKGLMEAGLMQEIDLSLEIPSKTAEKLINEEVDIGLVPVGILPQLQDYHIITDYCIGATGPVATVALYANQSVDQLKKIWLDFHSCTSVRLVQVLCKEYWGLKDVEFVNAKTGYIDQIGGTTGGVIIGDRTIQLGERFAYSYDLAEHWIKMTQLPFVFAAWVSRKPLAEAWVQRFNDAFTLGMERMEEVIATHQPDYPHFDVRQYLTKNISFKLTDRKRAGLVRFLGCLGGMACDSSLNRAVGV